MIRRALPSLFLLLSLLLLCGAFLLAMTSCKGRTMENVEPTGDTVEVVIPSAEVALDSAIAN